MLFISSPFRVSIIGGGTDYQKYFNEYSGRSIGFAINQGCLISVNNNPNKIFNYRLVYSGIEETNNPEEIKHKMLYTLIKHREIKKIEIHYDATLGKCNGLGTSSAFACALTAYDLTQQNSLLEEYSIARGAITLERDLMNEFGGWQDQIYSAYGGICDISFSNNNFYVSQIKPNRDALNKLNENLFLIVQKRTTCETSLKNANIKLNQNIISLREFDNLYTATAQSLFNADIEDLKEIMKEAFQLKQKFTDVHNQETAPICEVLDSLNCAYKITGSGNGGGIFIIGDRELKDKIKVSLSKKGIKDLKIINLKIASRGTHIIEPFDLKN